jgi:hypothetical protein
MRTWGKAALLGAIAVALIALPAGASEGDKADDDRTPVQAEERTQARVHDDECAGDCDRTRAQEQRSEATERNSRAEIRVSDVDGYQVRQCMELCHRYRILL